MGFLHEEKEEEDTLERRIQLERRESWTKGEGNSLVYDPQHPCDFASSSVELDG